jgi:hypothetical protein
MKIDVQAQKNGMPLGPRPPSRALIKMPAGSPADLPSGRDAYDSRHGAFGSLDTGAPFWLLAMVRDRQSQRQFLNPREKRALEKLEASWLHALGEASAPFIADWVFRRQETLNLQDWQILAKSLSTAAGFEAPQVIYQPELQGGRGQFLFRVEGNLIQLAPHAAGTLSEWVATVAHETFHHFQQALIVDLYKGSALPEKVARLAPYYRDARIIYKALGSACPPDAHARQDLERGAWSYGRLVKTLLLKNLSDT